jgi:hypothetical protein
MQILAGRHRGTNGSAAETCAARSISTTMNVNGNALIESKRETNAAVRKKCQLRLRLAT